MASDRDVHVVFGTGPLGLAVMQELLARGKRVRMVNRSGSAPVPEGVEVIRADASEPESARRACAGAAVVYHCAMPPYTRWPELFPALTAGVMEGAAAAGARLVYADNLYGYGPVDGPMTESLPLRATGPKGRVRTQMAEALLEAHRAGKVPVAICRAPDFYGPWVRQAFLGEQVFGAAVAGRPAEVLGNLDVPHSHIYIDDFARALVTLGEREEALGQVWHAPCPEPVTTRRFLEMVYAAAGKPLKVRAAPRALLPLLGLLNPILRELREVLYMYERPFVVDHSKYAAAFGAETTPHEEAIQQTVAWYADRAARA